MKNNVTAIIQARMSSTRLPGKILMKVMDRPLFSYQIERLRFSKMIDNIIIITTDKKEDDAIVEFAKQEGLDFYRGSEDDVLDRYYQTAKQFKIDNILRLTSDCPLIDPPIIDEVITEYKNKDFDYIYTGPTFAEGLDCEMISFKALEKACAEATIPLDREHVTLYFRKNTDIFKCYIYNKKKNDSKYRITIDEECDFIVVKAIIETLYSSENPVFLFEKTREFLDNNPAIYSLNCKIPRNEGRKKKK